jgi:hypothetical protein
MPPNAQTPPQQPPKPEVSPEQQAKILADAGLDPKLLQALMYLMREQNKTFMEGIAELRKPSAAEAEKEEKEKARILQARKNAAEQGAAVEAQIRAEQASCTHMKPNGAHTFRGQCHSDGWAEIKCVRCLLRFRVKPLPEHIAQGLNLEDVPGLDVAILTAWAKNSRKIERQLNDAALKQAQAQQSIRVVPEKEDVAIRGI